MKHSMGLIALVLLGLSLVSCGADEPTATPTPAEETQYSIRVFVNGETVANLSLADVESLPQRIVEAEEGPTLLSVLEKAGVQRFKRVVVKGLKQGRKEAAELSLDRNLITDAVILDITNRGTTKLVGADIPREQWVLDIGRLEVQRGGDEPLEAEYVLEVLFNGEKKASFSIDDIKGMPQETIDSVVGTQEGPALATVLEEAGVAQFTRVVVVGMAPGRQGDAELSLARAEVTDALILDITGRETTKLAGADLPREQWVVDVSRLEVE